MGSLDAGAEARTKLVLILAEHRGKSRSDTPRGVTILDLDDQRDSFVRPMQLN